MMSMFHDRRDRFTPDGFPFSGGVFEDKEHGNYSVIYCSRCLCDGPKVRQEYRLDLAAQAAREIGWFVQTVHPATTLCVDCLAKNGR